MLMYYHAATNQEWHLDDISGEAILPEGCVRVSETEMEAIRLAAIPVPTQEEIQQALLAKLDEHIDSVAKFKGYDSRITCALRAGYVNPWQQEGIAFGTWMDACYAMAYQIQADVLAGTRPTPTAEQLIAEMPVMVWPA